MKERAKVVEGRMLGLIQASIRGTIFMQFKSIKHTTSLENVVLGGFAASGGFNTNGGAKSFSG